MKRRLIAYFVLLSVVVDHVKCVGNYVILAPSYVRDRQPYQLSISTIGSGDSPNLQLSIEGYAESDEEVQIVHRVQLESDATRLVELNTTNLQPGAYSLMIRSLSGDGIHREIPLTFLNWPVVVLIQTDKPIYRPGNTIKFRVLALDQNTKPLENLKSIRVTLSDPDENVIKVWPFAKLRNGVFQSQLDIATEPILGNWTLSAIVRGKEIVRPIFVDEYKLPKQKITISMPKPITFSDDEFVVDINAFYIFGKPVKGRVTVIAEGSEKIIKTNKINGRLRVTFGLHNLFPNSLDTGMPPLVFVEVILQELHTKRDLHATNTFEIIDSPYQIELQKSSKHFIPGHPYKCWLQIKDSYGLKINSFLKQASLQIAFIGPDQFYKSVEMRSTPNGDGIIPLTLAIPEQTSDLELEVHYDGSSKHFHLKRDPSRSVDRFQVSVVTQKVVLNQPISVQIHSMIPLDFVSYQIVSKQKILHVKRVKVDGENPMILNITATADMIPRAKIFLFTIRNGTILSDSVTVEVPYLPNTINLTLSDLQATPGQKIKFSIHSQPNSAIGLAAIDKSALMLENGNKITKRAVFDELENNFMEAIDSDEIIVISNANQPIVLSARFGASDADEEDAYVPPRKAFSESWLWSDINEVGSDGHLTLWDRVPDAITTWEISAFSLHPQFGLGVLEQETSLNVFKPFFIMMNFPNSIKKSEIAIIEVSLFNYLDEMLYVGVTLKNSRQEFEFVDNRGRVDASYQAKNVVVMPNSATSTIFLIKSKKMGNIVIKSIAESTEASDSVERLLRVTPESLPYNLKDMRFIQVERSSQSFELKMKIPRYIDGGSENISFSVHGNLLGNAVDDLDDHIRLPSGSGEQNVLKMVPNIVVLDYSADTGTFGDVVKKRAVQFLEIGYQNELKFKHYDGSFSMYGKHDGKGSVFITALVAKTFQQASKYITIDTKVIEKAYDWLKSQQKSSGSFIEHDPSHNEGLQGVHNEEETLTAYTLVAFLEDGHIAKKYKSVIDKGTSYLSSKYQNMKSVYALSLTAYALELANHEAKDRAYDEMVLQSTSDYKRELRWWETTSMSVETAAYALLTYIRKGSYIDPKPIMNWMVTKPYYGGGFENTQTTFVGLQALAEYAKKISANRNRYDVTVKYGSQKNVTAHIDPQTSLSVQKINLPADVRNVKVTIDGTGTGIFSLEYSYYSNILNLKPRFDVKVKTLNTTTDKYLDLTVCAKFKSSEESSLVLMEITYPSGYIALDDSVEELEASDIVKKVVSKYGEASLVLYFETLPQHFQCLNVTGFRESEVLQQIPGTVRVYDFYDNTRVAIAYFDGKQLQLCDICENDCPVECRGSNI